jgi:hypothetical protein
LPYDFVGLLPVAVLNVFVRAEVRYMVVSHHSEAFCLGELQQ